MHTVLQFDYADIDGLKIASATGSGALLCDDGTWAFDQIMFRLEDDSVLLVSVTADTDELIVDLIAPVPGDSTSRQQAYETETLHDLNGMALGWCWIGTNWRGYKDMFVLSFNGIEPGLMFVAQGAKINLFRLEPKR